MNNEKLNVETEFMSTRGITLIALIITIIVMLILAIVSIKVASDSGLFSKAETAQKKTLIESAREKAGDIVMQYYDSTTGEITKDQTQRMNFLSALNGLGGNVSQEGNLWRVTMADGSNFTISEDGTIGNAILAGQTDGGPSGNNNNPILIGTDTVKIGQLAYVINDEINKTATVYGYRENGSYVNIDDIAGDPVTSGNVEIASVVKINDEDYTVTTVGRTAFDALNNGYGAATNLTGVVLPNTITSIGDFAFSSCSSLSNITIPTSVTSIGDAAFSSCSSLSNITIPTSVTSIGDSAFSSCSSLSNITIPTSVTSIGAYAFDRTPWLAFQAENAPNGLLIINGILISGTTATAAVQIPNGVREIHSSCFIHNTNITSVQIPNSVTKIGNTAFSGCTSIVEIIIPSTVNEVNGMMGIFGGWTNSQTIKVSWQEGQKPEGWANNWNFACNANIVYGYTN